MKRKKQLSVVLMFFVLISSFIMRIIDFWVFNQEIQLLGNYFESTLLDVEEICYVKEISVNEIYILLLSLLMHIFGNGVTAVIILNMISQLLIIMLIYLVVNEFGNVYVASIVAMIISILLLLTDKLYEISGFHLCIICLLLLIYAIWVIAKKIYSKKNANIVKGQRTEDVYAYDEVKTVITLDDILGQEIKNTEKQDLIVSENLQEAPKGMTEIQIEDGEKSKTQYIENPLPVPKRKEHKQMDYAIDTLIENDDFDIKDMTGIDFFDIE